MIILVTSRKFDAITRATVEIAALPNNIDVEKVKKIREMIESFCFNGWLKEFSFTFTRETVDIFNQFNAILSSKNATET